MSRPNDDETASADAWLLRQIVQESFADEGPPAAVWQRIRACRASAACQGDHALGVIGEPGATAVCRKTEPPRRQGRQGEGLEGFWFVGSGHRRDSHERAHKPQTRNQEPVVALPLHGRGGGGDGLLSAWRRAAGRVAVAAALALAVALGAEHQTLLTPSVAPPDEVAMLAPTPDEGTDGLSPADAALPAPGALNRMAELSGQERTEAVDFWTPPIQHVPVSPSLHRQPVERESSPVALSLRYLAKLQARAEAASDQPLPRRWSRSTVPETLSQRYLRVMSDE